MRSAVGKYIGQHPEEPASKALVALTLQYGHYDIRKVASVSETAPGKPSVPVNISYLSQIIDDLSRHAASYPVHLQFADDRPRAEHDVTAIAGLLDPGATVFVFTSENNGGQGLIARGVVIHAEAIPRKRGIARQTPRVGVRIKRTALAKRPLGRRELKQLTDWNDGQPGTELNFKFYRQATNKVVAISGAAASYLSKCF